MGLLKAVGFDRISNGTELEAYTGLDAGVPSEVASVQEDVIRQGGVENWISPGTSSSTTRFIEAIDTSQSGPFELEFSFHFHIDPAATVGPSLLIAQLHGLSTSPAIQLRSANNPVSGQPPVLQVACVLGYFPVTTTNVVLIPGMAYGVTMRAKTDPNNVGRGVYEVYINGTEVVSVDNASTQSPFNETAGTWRTRFLTGTSNRYHRFRNLSIRDTWSTPPNVSPPVPYVIDLESSGVTGTDYSTTGGAATLHEAINDNDQVTGITTDVADAEAIVNLDIPADLAGLTVLGVDARIRAGRLTPDPTELGVDILDVANASLASISEPVNASSPGREDLEVIYDNIGGAAAISVDDISLSLTNVDV